MDMAAELMAMGMCPKCNILSRDITDWWMIDYCTWGRIGRRLTIWDRRLAVFKPREVDQESWQPALDVDGNPVTFWTDCIPEPEVRGRMTFIGYDMFGKAEIGVDISSLGSIPDFAKPYEIGCSADIRKFVKERPADPCSCRGPGSCAQAVRSSCGVGISTVLSAAPRSPTTSREREWRQT